MLKNRSNLKNVATIVACLVVSMMLSCCSKPHTKIISTTVETRIDTEGGVAYAFEGYRPARIDFIVYNFGKLPSVSDPTDYKEVSAWLVNYAHCYKNGVELERNYYYHYEDEFKKGKKCKITAFYQVPDDEGFGGLSFKFDLEGLSVSYDGEFTNNVK